MRIKTPGYLRSTNRACCKRSIPAVLLMAISPTVAALDASELGPIPPCRLALAADQTARNRRRGMAASDTCAGRLERGGRRRVRRGKGVPTSPPASGHAEAPGPVLPRPRQLLQRVLRQRQSRCPPPALRRLGKQADADNLNPAWPGGCDDLHVREMPKRLPRQRVTCNPAAGLADLGKHRPLLVGQLGKLVTVYEERVGRVDTAAAAQLALLNIRRGAASTQTRNRPPTIVGSRRKCGRAATPLRAAHVAPLRRGPASRGASRAVAGVGVAPTRRGTAPVAGRPRCRCAPPQGPPRAARGRAPSRRSSRRGTSRGPDVP